MSWPLRVVAFALGACISGACAPKGAGPSTTFVLSSDELRGWGTYLASIDRFLASRAPRRNDLLVEVRARLAENLAALSRARVELPRELALRAGRLVAALDLLEERHRALALSRSPGRTEPRHAPGGDRPFVLDGPTAPAMVARAPEPKPSTLWRAAPDALRDDGDPDASISEGEIDDGGPPVDIVPPAPPPTSFLRWPLAAARINSRFGYRRDPIHGRLRFHDGVDLAAPRGAVVQAAAAGRVTFAGRRGGGGNVVVLAHGAGVKTVYAHLDHIALAPGARVRGGDVVGLVGSTGRATGPHLHFIVRVGGRLTDPLGVVGKSRLALEQLAALEAR